MNRNARVSSSVLDRIVETKRAELSALYANEAAIRAAAETAPPVPGFATALRAGHHVAVIAEVKRRSPSAGEIAGDVVAADVAQRYEAAGASAISVLTDRDYFGGSLEDLRSVRAAVSVPLLRKDFTIDALQVYEARAAGASAVLLIVRILEDARLVELYRLATSLGLDVLVEVHDAGEVERAVSFGAQMIGVNNRDLATFTTDLDTTLRLVPLVPPSCVLVAESGIRDAGDVARVAEAGVNAVLVGESLMRGGAAQARAMTVVERRPRA